MGPAATGLWRVTCTPWVTSTGSGGSCSPGLRRAGQTCPLRALILPWAPAAWRGPEAPACRGAQCAAFPARRREGGTATLAHLRQVQLRPSRPRPTVRDLLQWGPHNRPPPEPTACTAPHKQFIPLAFAARRDQKHHCLLSMSSGDRAAVSRVRQDPLLTESLVQGAYQGDPSQHQRDPSQHQASAGTWFCAGLPVHPWLSHAAGAARCLPQPWPRTGGAPRHRGGGTAKAADPDPAAEQCEEADNSARLPPGAAGQRA